MPLYEFACPACEHTFEELVFEGDKVSCPECHGTKVTKLMSLPGLARANTSPLPSACGDPSLPPCGASWCQRKGS